VEADRFDRFARLLSDGATRRGIVRTLGGLSLTGILASLLGHADAEAKKKRKKKKKCKKAGAACSTNKQCCPGKTKRICDIETGDSGGDKECCGAQGANCGGVNEDGDALPPFCCIGSAGVNEFICSESNPLNPNTPGTCIQVI
jgi:hypothetical protein